MDMEDVILPPSPPPRSQSSSIAITQYQNLHNDDVINHHNNNPFMNRNTINFKSSCHIAENRLSSYPYGIWEKVEVRQSIGSIPCQRSLHAGAIWKDYFIVFGGYDGHHRVNDLHSYSFKLNQWKILGMYNQFLPQNQPPSPRDRHISVVYENCLYIFGGFDGEARVNDLHAYDLELNQWQQVSPRVTAPGVIADGVVNQAPSPRHSHAAVIYKHAMYIFGGYDGSYRNDMYEFDFTRLVWTQVQCHGELPKARYRGTCVVYGSSMILHGGHDGNRHLQDTHVFDFHTHTWNVLMTEGPIPSPRDSHVAVVFGNSMFLYGGSTGSAMGDFHELQLDTRVWSLVPYANTTNIIQNPLTPSQHQQQQSLHDNHQVLHRNNSMARDPDVIGDLSTPRRRSSETTFQEENTFSHQIRASHSSVEFAGQSSIVPFSTAINPGVRFCHVGFVYDAALYIFGGYDGQHRLNDFIKFNFDTRFNRGDQLPSTLIADLKSNVNSDLLSDVQFIVEGIAINAHKILCIRCPYFRNLLTGEYMESRASSIIIPDVSHSIFILILEYLYSDDVTINMSNAMMLFQAADRFGIERLKQLCESEMLAAISIETAPHILLSADQFNAENLRERCFSYILKHFDEISGTSDFEEMGRNNIDLVFEILRKRSEMK